ncbi:MAG TPA: DUF4865 family protein [Alphaproteobacteria bacterium]|nr:DUF4865 family protein [Alphaproteobacteria bacterium]
MLAMHYRIPLSGGTEAVAAIRRRARERGPLFDGMPGLAHKLFLVDPVEPTYATFYLWREAEAALAFLDGEFFAALCASFGRPRVRLLLPRIIIPPPALPDALGLLEGDPAIAAGARIEALDPCDGSAMTLAFTESPGRRLEIMYAATGAAPLPAWPSMQPALAAGRAS